MSPSPILQLWKRHYLRLTIAVVVLLVGIFILRIMATPTPQEIMARSLALQEKLEPCGLRTYALTQALITWQRQLPADTQKEMVKQSMSGTQLYAHITAPERTKIIEEAFTEAEKMARDNPALLSPQGISQLVMQSSLQCSQAVMDELD